MSGQTNQSESGQETNANSAKRRTFRSSKPGLVWEVALAILAFGVVYARINGGLRLGPSWLIPSILLLLVFARIAAARTNRHDVARIAALLGVTIGTVAIEVSVAMLVHRLLEQDVSAPYLLRDAAMLWVANVIIFGVWYWEIDGGGHHTRRVEGYRPTDLAFPQIQLERLFPDGWTPQFIDYLFVSFNASAAFSPTDTLFLSRRAKILMMLQAMNSVVLIAVVAARAVNILH